MKPLLKWAGGKRHISQILEAHLPENWGNGTFYEPFLGGAALFLHLNPPKAFLADVNPKLVNFYIEVRDNTSQLLSAIEDIARQFDSLSELNRVDYYLALRQDFNSDVSRLESAALFYALNKLCFNGLYRENSQGKFNVPSGKKTKFPTLAHGDFLEVASRLSGASIELSDFEKSVAKSVSGDFVYFDPPYVPLNATSSFTAYSAEGFGLEDQRRLAATLSELHERGVRAMLSNSYSDVTREIYKGLRQVKISAPRMVSANGSRRGQVDELLVMNY